MHVDCVYRTCFFTSDSTMKKTDFMKMINESFPTGGLTCSFQDQQLSEFIQAKRRLATHIPTKKVVKTVGPQNADLWVLGPDIIINSEGRSVSSEESEFIWISNLYNGPGVALNTSACLVRTPLQTEPLIQLFEILETIMMHNFFPSIFTLAAFAKALHYETIKKKFKNCQMPLIFGCSGTGKTTVAKCALALTGSLPNRFWSQASKEMYMNLCCNGSLPLLIDDPSYKQAISNLAVALFDGAFEGTISRGSAKPSCMAMVTANFTVTENEKYVHNNHE